MWILLGTFWPVLGMALVAFLAIFIRKARWWILFLGPIVVMVPCFVFGNVIGQNGNLLFIALFLSLLAGLCIYYPVLAVTGLIVFYRRSRAR